MTKIRLLIIEDSPDDAELYDQRRRTYMRMADYERALSDAQECVQLNPDENVYHFHVFCALVALGNLEQAQTQYNEVFNLNWESKREFADWARK